MREVLSSMAGLKLQKEALDCKLSWKKKLYPQFWIFWSVEIVEEFSTIDVGSYWAYNRPVIVLQ